MSISSTARRRRAAAIQDAIRQILFRDWDPIAVHDHKNAVDEYDSFIAPVYRILTESRSEDELVNVLSRLGGDLTGQPGRRQSEYLRTVVRRLLALDVRL